MSTQESKVTPFLSFQGDAEEAVNFYVATFKNAGIDHVSRYGDAIPDKAGSVMTIAFHLEGQDFIALNGGPDDPFNLAISFMINCATQSDVDELWEKLLAGGATPKMCGWIQDRYGVAWQIVPDGLMEIWDAEPAAAKRAMEAMFAMEKLDINVLRAARDGKSPS